MQLISAFFGPGSGIVQRRTLDRVEVENAVRRAMTDVSFSFIVIHVSKEKTASFIIEKRLFSHLICFIYATVDLWTICKRCCWRVQ